VQRVRRTLSNGSVRRPRIGWHGQQPFSRLVKKLPSGGNFGRMTVTHENGTKPSHSTRPFRDGPILQVAGHASIFYQLPPCSLKLRRSPRLQLLISRKSNRNANNPIVFPLESCCFSSRAADVAAAFSNMFTDHLHIIVSLSSCRAIMSVDPSKTQRKEAS